MKSLLLFTLTVVFLLGACAQGGEKELKPVFEKMKEAGCSADVEGFFSFIDEGALKTNFDKNVLDKVLSGAYDSMLSERSQELGPEGLKNAAEKYVSGVLALYREQVEKGRFGSICRMQIVRVEKYTITVKMPGEPDIIWTYGKTEDGLKLVSVY